MHWAIDRWVSHFRLRRAAVRFAEEGWKVMPGAAAADAPVQRGGPLGGLPDDVAWRLPTSEQAQAALVAARGDSRTYLHSTVDMELLRRAA